ncbi:isocitrate lyase/phosphoenolpyruvate mutase family protein [Saccharothrix violaceirubra]|uniref:2-methylisocitrate lyase-like PEP mutase family enzyme n=1 Tax=Saccharothrix violaceirubra TaxID=413306 RepID=A0A7W7T3L8_9PSEU|nr:isocitrate lyase/phosphoenolpyruvate mutase family protein [Saccharothrix violaceirubra]MBB4965953.1 2-methylisocitrate lyase-like PEP mutase family enzyme [Saccharothrix violaceirubra]
MTSRTDRAKLLRALHVPGDPVVLPNVWDAASARAVAGAGFPAVATASAAVSASLGYADGEDMPVREAFAAVARVARAVDVPVTADVERGYRLSPDELVGLLAEAGAVGCNLEDTDPATRGLADVDRQAGFLAAVRAADPDLVINARTDARDYDTAVDRARAYLAAGADSVYPIFLDHDRIADFVRAVDAPVNVLHRPGTTPPAGLAALGVARVSLGPFLHREVMAHLAAVVAGVHGGGGL